MESAHDEHGFTLIEVAIAVAILGVALTALIGLHTRMLDTYYQERNRTRAAFIAQYVMTKIEVAADAPDPGSKEGELDDLLEDIDYFGDHSAQGEKESFAAWSYRQEVTSVDLPLLHDSLRPLLEDALRRVDLEIRWGPGPEEEFSLVYFVSPQKQSQGGAPGGANPLGGSPFGTAAAPQP